MQLNIFAVLRSLTLFKSHISFGERIISYDRAETNQDRQNNSPMTRQFTLHIICINLQLRFYADNFENVRTFTQFMKKYSSYIFLLNQGRRSIF